MNSEWRKTTIGEVATLQRGFDLPIQDRQDGNVPVFASTGVAGFHSVAMVKSPGVIIGRSGSIGGAQFVTEDFWPLNTTLWVKDFHGNDPKFIYYLFKTLDFGAYNSGTGVPSLNRNHIHPLPVRIPRLPEQKAIARVLGSLDDKIELNRRMNATLEAMAQALFRAWFVDFEPVKANAAGVAPHPGPLPRRGEGVLPSPFEGEGPGVREIAALFPSEFEPSTLGLIPKGWEVSTIGDLVEIVGGGTPSTKVAEYWNGEYSWATPKDFSSLQFPILLNTERQITDAGLKKISSGLLPRGAVLLSSRAPIGYLAITEIPVAINQGFIAMIPRENISNLFILHWSKANLEIIKSRANGSTFLEISKTNFRPIPVVRPPQALMELFDRSTRSLFEQMVNNEKQSQTLAQLRDALLPRLISGRLRVPLTPALSPVGRGSEADGSAAGGSATDGDKSPSPFEGEGLG